MYNSLQKKHNVPHSLSDVRHWIIALVIHVCPSYIVPLPNEKTTCILYTHYQQLLQCATEFVEQIICKCNTSVSNELTSCYRCFCDAFQTWKDADTKQLFHDMVIFYINIEETMWIVQLTNGQQMLDKLQQNVDTLGFSSETFRTEIATQKACVIEHQAVSHAQIIVNNISNSDQRPKELHRNPNDNTPPLSMYEDSIECTVKRAFWDAFVSRLRDGHTDQLQLLLDELKTKLNALTHHDMTFIVP